MSDQPVLRRHFTAAPWEKKVAYCRALRKGSHIAVTGTAATAPDGEVIGISDGYLQAKRCLEIIDESLRALDSGLKDVIRTRMFVTDISRWEEYARAHREAFKDSPPTTTMVEVQRLIHPWMLIEIEADAITD